MLQKLVHDHQWNFRKWSLPVKKQEYRGLTAYVPDNSNWIVKMVLLTGLVVIMVMWGIHQVKCWQGAIQAESIEYASYSQGDKTVVVTSGKGSE